jgi:uncharacterized membrane protein YphA (DoxX/SURF4 family)
MKNKIQFVLCLLVGLLFINAGLDKFFHYMPMPKEMSQKMIEQGTAFMTISWLLPLVAVVEILGGVLLIFKSTRPLGAIVLLPVLVGILLANITMAPSGIPLVIVILAIVGWVIIENRNKYLPLVKG